MTGLPRRSAATPLTLAEASERMHVHYMTAYRYVRTGACLPPSATERGGQRARDVDRLVEHGTAAAGRGHTAHGRRVPELVDRLIAGDEPGAWTLVQNVLGWGTSPSDLYMQVLVPALQLIGERWNTARSPWPTSIAPPRSCTGSSAAPARSSAGPDGTRGIVVLGAPEGELHAMPTALAADLLRASGFVVIDLGANVPTQSFVECVQRLPRVTAVGVTVTTPERRAAAARLVAAIARRASTCPSSWAAGHRRGECAAPRRRRLGPARAPADRPPRA